MNVVATSVLRMASSNDSFVLLRDRTFRVLEHIHHAAGSCSERAMCAWTC
jgi:hypothetical protein